MKRNIVLSIGIICILFINMQCSAQMNQLIEFEKEIQVDHNTSLGTLTTIKKNNYLFIHDSHVSNRKLICVDYNTGKKVWDCPEEASGFFFYNNFVVINGNSKIAAYNIKNLEQVWELLNYYIKYSYIDGKNFIQPDVVVRGKDEGILNLSNGNFKTGKDIINVNAFRFQTEKIGMVELGYYPVPELIIKTGIKDKYLKSFLIEKKNGDKTYFIWTLNEETRQFKITKFDNGFNNVKNVTW